MTVPLAALLTFAAWTLTVLLLGVGIRRWALILTGRAGLADFPADKPHGSDAYRRAMRAHANCVENLPVFGAVVIVAHLTNVASPTMDMLAQAVVAARTCQSLVHLIFVEASLSVFVRFSFFFLQLIAMFSMMSEILTHA